MFVERSTAQKKGADAKIGVLIGQKTDKSFNIMDSYIEPWTLRLKR